MSNTTLNLAKLSIRERLDLVRKRFKDMDPKVYDDSYDWSEKEESIHRLLFNLIGYYQNLLSYDEYLAYVWGC
jgi:hypothetical protein